jgi:hypothetical protein
METIYKNKRIVFSEVSELWGLMEDGESVYENVSLSSVKEYIDKYEKEGFKRYDCFAVSWHGGNEFEIREATVTSEPNSDEVWLKFKDGKDRRKERKRNVIENTAKNRVAIEKLRMLHAEKVVLEEQMTDLKRTLTRLEKMKGEYAE